MWLHFRGNEKNAPISDSHGSAVEPRQCLSKTPNANCRNPLSETFTLADSKRKPAVLLRTPLTPDITCSPSWPLGRDADLSDPGQTDWRTVSSHRQWNAPFGDSPKLLLLVHCDGGIVVSIAAFQAVDPGSIPGHRKLCQQHSTSVLHKVHSLSRCKCVTYALAF